MSFGILYTRCIVTYSCVASKAIRARRVQPYDPTDILPNKRQLCRTCCLVCLRKCIEIALIHTLFICTDLTQYYTNCCTTYRGCLRSWKHFAPCVHKLGIVDTPSGTKNAESDSYQHVRTSHRVLAVTYADAQEIKHVLNGT